MRAHTCDRRKGLYMVMNAFLVEDQADIRDTLVGAMEELVPLIFVGVASSESAAKKWLSRNDGLWDLAIVDLFLGQGTGFGVLDTCRARSATQKVVVLTSYNGQNMLDLCKELGADEVFDKTQDIEKLVDFCRSHAANLESMSDYGLITELPDAPF